MTAEVGPIELLREPLAHLDDARRPHSLREHLHEVAAGASRFAEAFQAGSWPTSLGCGMTWVSTPADFNG